MFIVVFLLYVFTLGLPDEGSAAHFKSETKSCRRTTADTTGRNESSNQINYD